MALHSYQREVARALGVVRDRLPPGRPIVYMNPWARHLAAMPKLWRWAGGGVKMSLVEEVGRFVSVDMGGGPGVGRRPGPAPLRPGDEQVTGGLSRGGV